MKMLKGLALFFMASAITLGVSAQGTTTSTSSKSAAHAKTPAKSTKTTSKAGAKPTPAHAATNKSAGGSAK
jgi:hypothetical protein